MELGLDLRKSLSQIDEENVDELQYLEQIRYILKNGIEKPDRTGTGIYSIFGTQMRFNIRNNIFPLLTTKRMFYRGIIEEFLWFTKGSTDAKELQKKKVRIWDGNTSREFLDSRGLTHLDEGDCGPIYGFNFRHFGAKYKGCHTDYTGEGYDQLMETVRLIREEPHSRRILITLWNPTQLKEVCLPPCHHTYQFWVANGELSCFLYQRSSDFFLAGNYNLCTAVLLVHMLIKLSNCGLKPGEVIHSIGDTHIYKNHVEQCHKQLTRKPYSFPTIQLNADKEYKTPEDFEYSDFKIIGYKYHPAIKAPMAV
jgi:thymidylate synthase